MLGILASVLPSIFGLIDKAVPDAVQAASIRAKIQTMAMDGDLKELEAAVGVIQAEARGNWIQRSWRPMLMMLFGIIIANNYLVVPLFGTPSAAIPPDMWALLKLGIGGYVLGRSAEKGIIAWKK